MNWITDVVRPKIQGIWQKKDTPENLWITCPETGEMVFHRDVEANHFVIPTSNYHLRMTGTQRLKHLFAGEDYQEIAVADVPHDPLRFRDQRRYSDRLRDARTATGRNDAVTVAYGTLDGIDITACVQDFSFMGGSLGMAAGEAIVAAFETAAERQTPMVLFAGSGGARMQEGILSLMQMPRTTVGLQKLKRAGLPYIVVLTNPTTGGVTASYAMLGDVHIAEPGALVGFAGPRVIEQTIREKLPEGFQRSEYLLEHGMLDMVIHRHQLPETIARLCRLFLNRPPQVTGAAGDGDDETGIDAPIEAQTEQPPEAVNENEQRPLAAEFTKTGPIETTPPDSAPAEPMRPVPTPAPGFFPSPAKA